MIGEIIDWAWTKPHFACVSAAGIFVLGKMSFEIFVVALTQTQ